jgi:hypothetical protein
MQAAMEISGPAGAPSPPRLVASLAPGIGVGVPIAPAVVTMMRSIATPVESAQLAMAQAAQRLQLTAAAATAVLPGVQTRSVRARRTSKPETKGSLPEESDSEEEEPVIRAFEEQDRACAQAVQRLHVGKKLGEGQFKTVFALCADAKCEKETEDVLQIVAIDDPAVLAELRKEVQLMVAVQREAAAQKRAPVILRIKSYTECQKRRKAFFVQERAQGTMEGLGARQFQALLNSTGFFFDADPQWLLFSLDQLREVFAAAQSLYRRFGGLVHGDLKPDNVLVKNGQFYLADFGLSGALRGQFGDLGSPRAGFSRIFGCPGDVPVNPQIRAHYNVWQLELALRAYYLVLVEYPPLHGYRVFRRFESVDQLGLADVGIPPQVRVQLDASCFLLPPGINKAEAKYADFRGIIAGYYALHPGQDGGQNEITNSQVAEAMMAARSSPDYVQRFPAWIRRAIQQSLPYFLARSEAVFVPLPAPRTGGARLLLRAPPRARQTLHHPGRPWRHSSRPHF